jgi:RimJ/RimL family protein N-acetyltransferase
MSSLSIRLARTDDVEPFVDHVIRSSAESGRNGAPHFAITRAPIRQDVRDLARARWVRGLDEPLWGRAWVLLASPKEIVGHIELRGGRVRAELHRATLGMGIELAHTAKGHGRRLMSEAVRWARSEAKLAWIDLGVFSNNAPARRLYTSAGFVEIGVHRDAFRLDDVSIDDVLMSLELNGAP